MQAGIRSPNLVITPERSRNVVRGRLAEQLPPSPTDAGVYLATKLRIGDKKMNRTNKLTGFLAGIALALPAAALAGEVRESIQVADHFMFQPAPAEPTIAPGATILIRDLKNRVVTATLTSAALEAHTAYSIWWVIFNRPQNCAAPWQCGSGDLGNSAVRPSVFWAGGLLADGDGYGNTQIELVQGRTDRELFGPMKDTGLRNITNAEIHLVLRTHGPVGVAGPVADQIGFRKPGLPR